MRDDLVAVEIEVDPVVAAAPFAAAHHPAPERPRLRQITDGESQMERAQGHGVNSGLMRPDLNTA